MPTNLTALRARFVAMLEAEGRATPGPWAYVPGASLWLGDEDSSDETFSGDAILADKDIVIANTHYDLEPKQVDGAVIVAARNSFRPLLTLALGLIDGCDQCEWCLGLGEITMLSTKPCWHCAPSRTLLKRLAEELDK